MPEGLDPRFWDATGGKVNTDLLIKDHQELSGFKKAHDEAKAALPKDGKDYKFAFVAPEGFKMPDGMKEIAVDQNDPRIPFVRNLAVKHGWSQAVVDDLVAANIQAQLAEHNLNLEIAAAERAKLGEKGPARMDAMKTFLGKDFEILSLVMDNHEAFEAMERLIARIGTTQIPGGGAPPEPPKPPPKTLADRMWPGMSGSERKAS